MKTFALAWLPYALALAGMPSPAHAADDLARDRPAGEIETVATFDGPMPTGVTVSHSGRIFVCYPKWGDKVDFTVAEVKDGKPVAYPDQATNQAAGPQRRTTPDLGAERRRRPERPALGRRHRQRRVRPDLARRPEAGLHRPGDEQGLPDIPFPPEVVLPTSYINDVRFDLRRGEAGYAFLTDSSDKGPNGIIVVDLASGRSWRRLHDHPTTKADPAMLALVEGRPVMERPPGGPPKPVTMGSDGIAIAHDGSRLFYCPLVSRRLYSVSVDALVDARIADSQVATTVLDHGEKGPSDGLESDDRGRVYATNYEQNAVLRRSPDGRFETLVHDPRVLWPDTLSVARDGHLYFTANQLHRQARYHEGKDLRQKPYVLFRVKIDAGPVRLTR